MTKVFGQKHLKTTLAALVVISTMSVMRAEAAQELATLSGLQINPTENSYQIVLKSDKNFTVQKHANAQNDLVLDVTGAKASDAINTVYNNTNKIDHVIFQPVSDNHVRIFIQGENVSASSITVDAKQLPLGLLDQSSVYKSGNTEDEKIVLNRPVDTYRSVTNLESQAGSENVSDNPLQSGLLSGLSLKNILNSSKAGWLLSLAMMMLSVIFGFKVFQPKDKKVSVDLSSGIKERELDLYRSLNKNQGMIGGSLGGNRPKATAATGLQTNSIKNYGLREYQNSQVNPSQPVGLSRINTAYKSPALKPQPSVQKKNTRTARTDRTLSTSTISKKEVSAAKSNIDSMQFLESMARIYEKSGRVDLAHGLQNNMMKAKIAKHGV